ncbi:MAG TPA: NAD-dependent epimerase/dehydratase family protein [Solirubrobacteraceae bacterium]|jgi:UDP-glucose 4-epimerase|nr:NAD-dependent epimerase/dehydratase family protein [Solirubrobacteraceae bacterium]
MRSVVTGGAGFIGSHLADGLLDAGDEVLVVDDLSSGRESNLTGALERGATLERLDVRDAPALLASFEAFRPDRVFHLAAQIDVRVSIEKPALDAEVNIIGTINALEAARHSGARRFVFASTGGAIYGETTVVPTSEAEEPLPMAGYGQSKYCAERYLGLYERLYGMSTMALRFSNVCGPRQDPSGEAGVIAIFCGCFRDGRPPTIFGDGTQTRDYLYVGDLVEALVAAGDSEATGVLNAGTRQETSVLDIVRLLGEIHGDGAPEPRFAPPRLGEVDRSCLDAGRAREVLGWEATTDITDALRRTYEAALADPR